MDTTECHLHKTSIALHMLLHIDSVVTHKHDVLLSFLAPSLLMQSAHRYGAVSSHQVPSSCRCVELSCRALGRSRWGANPYWRRSRAPAQTCAKGTKQSHWQTRHRVLQPQDRTQRSIPGRLWLLYNHQEAPDCRCVSIEKLQQLHWSIKLLFIL